MLLASTSMCVTRIRHWNSRESKPARLQLNLPIATPTALPLYHHATLREDKTVTNCCWPWRVLWRAVWAGCMWWVRGRASCSRWTTSCRTWARREPASRRQRRPRLPGRRAADRAPRRRCQMCLTVDSWLHTDLGSAAASSSFCASSVRPINCRETTISTFENAFMHSHKTRNIHIVATRWLSGSKCNGLEKYFLSLHRLC